MKETTFRVDGRKEMSRNPRPQRYVVVINRKTGKVEDAYKGQDLSGAEKRELIRNKKYYLETRYYANDAAFEKDTGLTFEK